MDASRIDAEATIPAHPNQRSSLHLRAWFRMPAELRDDSWGRWAWWVQVASMAFSVAAFIIVLVGSDGGLRRGLISLPIVLASIAWSWLSVLEYFRITNWLWGSIGYAFVDLGLLVSLILIDGSYGLAIFFVYWRMFAVVRFPWSIAMAGVYSVGVFKAFDGFSADMLSGSQFGVIVIALAGSTAVAWFIGSIISESYDRRVLVQQLEATRAQLARQEREAGVATERQRLAGELHDTLAQDFASIVMHLEAAGALTSDQSALQGHLAAAKETARSGLAESRRIVQALRPEMLQGRSLPEALDAQCRRWSGETSIACQFTQSGDVLELPRDVDVTLYRCLQEALTNVRKHARATTVMVTLSWLGDEVILDVHDNGRGMADLDVVPGDTGNRVGLITMRERAEALSGTATIESAPGEGTTVTMQIPITAEKER